MKRNSRHFVRKQNQQNERSRSPFFNLAHDESKQHPSFFQTQLKTGEKGDKYEKEADNAAGKVANKGSDIADRIKKTKGKGQPMAEKTAREMKQAFGADFSNVNIHTDEQAASLNKDLHSIAFTNGSDIYFAEGQYNPDSSSGKTLLAHELTHVIQQTGK
ncbi:MAG: DUF4157 domain-containing protein [Bacteroidota bacterium]|nr:DUF4157 domain-containing protein [Bacteroidota bacterium]